MRNMVLRRGSSEPRGKMRPSVFPRPPVPTCLRLTDPKLIYNRFGNPEKAIRGNAVVVTI